MKTYFSTLSLYLIPLIGCMAASPAVIHLDNLDHSSSWRISGADPDRMSIRTVADTLEVRFDPEPGVVTDLLLKESVPLPATVNDINFKFSGEVWPARMFVDVILEDAHGKTIYVRTKLPGANAYHRNLGVINTGLLKGQTVRITVPALDQPTNRDFFRNPQDRNPQKPWTWLGLRFYGDRHDHHKEVPINLYLRNFALSADAHLESSYTGIIRDTEFAVELDGDPGLKVWDFYNAPGTYVVMWEVYDNYAQAPIATFTETIDVDENDESRPLALQLGETLILPRLKTGTYWIRWRAQRYRLGMRSTQQPVSFKSGELRLYIHRQAGNLEALTKSQLPKGWINATPPEKTLIYEENNPVLLDIAASLPYGEEGEGTISYTVKTAGLNTQVLKDAITLSFADKNADSARIDLGELPPGAYRINLSYAFNGKVYDRQELLLGVATKPKDQQPLTQLPAGILNWKEAFARPEPYFHLSPMWHSATWKMKDYTRWHWFSNFLDEAPAVSDDIEYNIPWNRFEPLPGVYDWEEIDLFLNKAETKNLQVLVWPGFWGEEPEWLPTVPTQAADGRVFYDFAYDFHGVRQNYPHSNMLRDALSQALGSFVDHVKNHPAVQGYFLIQELPGDAPFMNWLSGYSDLALKGYRSWLRDEFQDEHQLSKRWGREVPSMSTVQVPDSAATNRERLDWLLFRASRHDSFVQHLLNVVREEDALRPIFLYGDLFGVDLTMEEVVAMGCAKANGGSHDAIHPFPISEIGLNGMLQRTEDHWPGKWTGYFDEVLEASVFAMSFGGGKAMNCKHYMFTYMPEIGTDRHITFDDLREPPYSLDEFERFKPIWTALRPTKRKPVEVVELLDTEAGLLTNGWLNRNGFWDGEAQEACYRSHINFAGDSFPLKNNPKLLMLIKSHLKILTDERINQLEHYVRNGGTLLMLAEAGRKNVDRPDEDWALLKEFGFEPPSYPVSMPGNVIATPVDGQVMDAKMQPFMLRGTWIKHAQENEEIVAVDSRNANKPLLTWKDHGKGKVAVLWGDRIIPRKADGVNGNILKSVATWAGAPDLMSSSNPHHWMNILYDDATGNYFGLVHAGQWQGRPKGVQSGNVRFRLDPAETYIVSDLARDVSYGTHQGSDLWDSGLDLSITPRQTAILQFQPVTTKDL